MYTLDFELSKKAIEKKVSQKQIFEHYFFPLHKQRTSFKSFIREEGNEDNSPSLLVEILDQDEIYWKDYGSGIYGDIYDLLQEYYGLPYFESVLLKINNDLNLNFILTPEGKNAMDKVAIDKEEAVVSPRANKSNFSTIIVTERTKWEQPDYLYWSQYGINQSDCMKFDIYPATKAWVSGGTIIKRPKGSLMYDYLIRSGNKIERDRHKIYIPSGVPIKFLTNAKFNDIDGIEVLRSGDVCVLTKSRKDVVCLDKFGVPAIGFQSESIIPEKSLISFLACQYKRAKILFDNDEPGVRYAKKFMESIEPFLGRLKLEVESIFIPENTDGAKDFSDWRATQGIGPAEDFIRQAINN